MRRCRSSVAGAARRRRGVAAGRFFGTGCCGAGFFETGFEARFVLTVFEARFVLVGFFETGFFETGFFETGFF